MSRLLELFLDNPIVVKDGLLALRRRRTLLGLAFTTLVVVVVSALIWLDESAAHEWAPTRPVGDGLLLAMFGLSFVIAGILLPAMASSTLAGEREHGTLPLLLVTGLSPTRIVIGKTIAMLVVVAPFVLTPLPAALFGALHAGVSLPLLAVGVAGLGVAMVAFAAVGVLASASTARARASAPAALLGAAIPAIFSAAPALNLVIEATQRDGAASEDLQLAVAGMVAGVVVAVAALYGAWSALAPRSSPRFGTGTVLFVGVVVGLPLVAAALGHLPWDLALPTAEAWRQAEPGLPVATSALFVVAAVLLYAAGVGHDRHAPSPLWLVPGAVLLMSVGYAAGLWLVIDPVREAQIGDFPDVAFVGVFWLHVLAAASLASLAGRFIRQPMLAAGLGAAGTLIVVLIPAIADEFYVGETPLPFLNFAYAGDALPQATLFWGALSVGALLMARRRGTVGHSAARR